MRIPQWLIVVAAVSLFVSCGLVKYERKLKRTTVEEIDLSDVKDGEYAGYYDLHLVSAKVRVVVRDGRIQELILEEHTHGDGYGADEIAERILAEQSVDVDAVTGATGSSTAIRKAVALALREGMDRD